MNETDWGDRSAARRDILLLSLGTTGGLRAGDAALADMLKRAGASVEVVSVRLGLTRGLRRAYPAIDLIEAVAARRALTSALTRIRPRAVIFSSTTASLLCRRIDVPYAVRLDSPAALNRPGARNAIQHALERRVLRDARLILPFSELAIAALPAGSAKAVVVPQPITPSGTHEPHASPVSRKPPLRSGTHAPPASSGTHEPAVSSETHEPAASSGTHEPAASRQPLAGCKLVVAYTPDPKAKGLDIVISAWARAELSSARLEVFGITEELALSHLRRHRIVAPAGVSWRGRVAPQAFRAALRDADVFLVGARWEDFGFAALEALADGALLVCAATSGPFEALIHARELQPQLCAPDRDPDSLANALKQAVGLSQEEVERYRRGARQRMAVYEPAVISATIAERMLPALLG